MRNDIRRGVVVEVKLDPAMGHEVSKKRPCVVIQNDIGNRVSPVTIVAPLVGAEHIEDLGGIHVFVPRGEAGILRDSVVKCNQLRTIDELLVGRVFGQLTIETMRRVDAALRVSLDL